MAKEFLSQKKIPYVERNVAYDSDAAAEMVSLSGQRGVPVIVVDQEIVVGFDRPRLDDCLRVTVGTDDEIDQLLGNMKEILAARH